MGLYNTWRYIYLHAKAAAVQEDRFRLLEFHLIEVAMYALRFPPLIFMCASFWRCVYGTAILNVVVLLHAIE